MNNGKNICKYLKEVRKNIADENNIPLEQTECTYKGECLGTCPHCEAEVQYIEQELSKKGKMNILGKAAAIAGLSLSMVACNTGRHQIVGDVPLRGKIAEPDTTHAKAVVDTPPQTPDIPEPLMGIVPVPERDIEPDSAAVKTAIDSVVEIEIPEKDMRLMGDVCAPVRKPSDKSKDKKE